MVEELSQDTNEKIELPVPSPTIDLKSKKFETVKVVLIGAEDRGPMVINRSSFDGGRHKQYVDWLKEKKAKKPKKAKKEEKEKKGKKNVPGRKKLSDNGGAEEETEEE
jgi:hypothetical protein